MRSTPAFQELDLPSTVVNNWLPDLDGTNTTSAEISAGPSPWWTAVSCWLPAAGSVSRGDGHVDHQHAAAQGLMRGLGGAQGEPDASLARKGYRVYNKTGDIGIAYADAGLIELPDGRRAVAGFLVEPSTTPDPPN